MQHSLHPRRLLLASALLALLICPALAADVRVDLASTYCFSAADFAATTRGVYLSELPATTVGSLHYGVRTLCPGDVLPVSALDVLEFHPASTAETECTLTYRAITDTGLTQPQTLTLALVAKKDTVPACADLRFETYKNISNTGTLSATDEDGDPLTYQLVKPPKRGTVELHEDGSFTYTPAHNKVGRDSFVYTATDPAGNISNEATVKIKIVKPTDTATFADLSGDALEYRAMALKDLGVYGGREIAGQLCFCPDETVTRGEFLVMAMRVLDLAPDDAILTAGFTDESETPAWMLPYLTAAYRSGLISGIQTDDGLAFRAASTLSEADCAVMLQNMLHLSDGDTQSVFSTLDAAEDSIAVWAVPSSAALQSVGIELSPRADLPITRRACAELLYQLSTLCQPDLLADLAWAE